MPSPIGNKFMKMIINSPLHPLLGKDIGVITVTGCKTGRSISTPINVVRVGDSMLVISFRNRTWWRNLRGGCISQLRHAGKLIPVQSVVIESPLEVADGLKDYFSQHPGYAKYFSLKFDPDGSPDPWDLKRLATERVLIKLQET
jgi:hypothetical protein